MRILRFVAIAAFITRARIWTRRRIDSQLQSFAVDIISQRFHVGKLLVRLDISLCVAAGLPGVIDIDVEIARVFHPIARHGVRNAAHSRIIHLAGELVPTVPAHRWSSRQAVIRDLVQGGKWIARRQDAFAGRRAHRHHLDGVVLRTSSC